jgi:hypothetical protein
MRDYKTAQQVKINNWADLVDKSCFQNLDESSFWLRIYYITGVSRDELFKKMRSFENVISLNDKKISFHCVVVSEEAIRPKFKFLEESLGTDQAGKLIIECNLIEKELPVGSYVLLNTSYKIDGQIDDGKEFATKSCLNEVESILALYLGNNFLYEIFFDGEMSLTDKGKYTIPSKPRALPQECDGPFLQKENWASISETFQKINEIVDQNKANRVRLALRFFQKGKNTFNDDESLFLYWTAIIALLEESGTMYINKKLQVLYNFTQEDVEKTLKWEWAYGIRNDILHKAKPVTFHMQIERYFQLLFLDLFRGELGLKCDELLLNYVRSFPKFI